MQPSTIYSIANYGVLPFWILLAVLPHHRVTRMLVHSGLVPGLLGLVYAWMFLSASPDPEANALSLEGVMQLFDSERVMVAAWIHYLIFDLFVGAWETRDAQRRGIPHLLVIPCLVATLMVGPIGLLLYVLVRFFSKRVLEYDEAGAQ